MLKKEEPKKQSKPACCCFILVAEGLMVLDTILENPNPKGAGGGGGGAGGPPLSGSEESPEMNGRSGPLAGSCGGSGTISEEGTNFGGSGGGSSPLVGGGSSPPRGIGGGSGPPRGIGGGSGPPRGIGGGSGPPRGSCDTIPELGFVGSGGGSSPYAGSDVGNDWYLDIVIYPSGIDTGAPGPSRGTWGAVGMYLGEDGSILLKSAFSSTSKVLKKKQ